MQLHTVSHLDKREPSDALVIAYFTNEYERDDLGSLQTLCQPPILAHDFEAKPGQIVTLWHDEPQEKRVFMLGLGARAHSSPETLRKSYAAITKACIKHGCKSLSILVPEVLEPDVTLKALLEGLLLPNYVFDSLKNQTKSENSPLEEVTLIGHDIHTKTAERTLKVMRAIWRARDIINGNADDITPEFLAQYAKDVAQEFPRIKTQVHDKAWIQKEGMGLLLAVARGSLHEPKFIVSSYVGDPVSSDVTVIVGKGITYDTGGLKLKSSDGMMTMRADMTGAAIALATVEAASSLGLALNVTCVLPCAENAISASSYKLGDVYKARNGLTVEITNTDAEGRLVLADALSWAVDTLNPTQVIDIGTLTGSMEIALGNELMGLFSNSDLVADELFTAGQKTHERMWRMPLYDEYREQLQSDVADIKNAVGPKGGSIICAMFLKQFVKDVPWAHLDIAPVAFAKEAKGYWPKNATGIGVRLLLEYLQKE
ncbi:MAG: leucyl aminopeptidase family protein [Chlamydiales bacterium]|nr:leucyl aminopeptidase family protein [Chlamydiales bacterium]